MGSSPIAQHHFLQNTKAKIGMEKVIITLTREEYETLRKELWRLESFLHCDDHTHADDCYSKVLSIIENQADEQGVR